MSSIRLDPKYGVNPMMALCFYCQEPGDIILFGQLNPKQREALGSMSGEAPRQMCISREPCAKCKEYMGQGIILISVDKNKSTDKTNPYRTGGWVVLKQEAVERIITSPEILESVLEKRIAFVPDEAWDFIGLPRGEVIDEATP
jgi:hypothetical protein